MSARSCPRCGCGLPEGVPPARCDCRWQHPYRCGECGDVIAEYEYRRWGMCWWCARQNDPWDTYEEEEEND